MAKYTTNEFKSGLKIIIDGNPYSILENEFVNPGKGQAFNRIKIRNLKTGRVLEKTFKSGESVEKADIEEIELQFLYKDRDVVHFMSPKIYEQYQINKQKLVDSEKWLKEQNTYVVTLWNGDVISVIPPNFINLKVIETEPGFKGDTATSGTKPATLENGTIIPVPLFINIGDNLKIDTRTGKYVSRTK